MIVHCPIVLQEREAVRCREEHGQDRSQLGQGRHSSRWLDRSDSPHEREEEAK